VLVSDVAKSLTSVFILLKLINWRDEQDERDVKELEYWSSFTLELQSRPTSRLAVYAPRA
jgi:hypothetical protein